MQMKRRQFLKTTAVGAAAALAPSLSLAQASKPPVYHNPVAVVPLGKTKIKMTRLGMGTGMRGGNRQSNHTRMGQEKFDALVKDCWERGVRWFDVADLYGTHPFLASSLQKIPRKDYVISTKIWWRNGGLPESERPSAEVVVERFLKELKTDYVDMVLLHCLGSGDWVTQLSQYMTDMAKLKKRGLIRAHGVSSHSLDALKVAATEPWVDSVHARINPFGAKMDGPVDEVAPVLKKIHDAGKGVVAMKVIGEGTFGDDAEKKNQSIRYVLQSEFVDVMTIGFEKREHISDFMARAEKVPVEA